MELDREDVVSCGDLSPFTGGKVLFEYWEIQAGLRNWLLAKSVQGQILTGVPCKFLRTTGGGWKNAKFRLRLELIVEPEPEPIKSKSVLDEFRPNID